MFAQDAISQSVQLRMQLLIMDDASEDSLCAKLHGRRTYLRLLGKKRVVPCSRGTADLSTAFGFYYRSRRDKAGKRRFDLIQCAMFAEARWKFSEFLLTKVVCVCIFFFWCSIWLFYDAFVNWILKIYSCIIRLCFRLLCSD